MKKSAAKTTRKKTQRSGRPAGRPAKSPAKIPQPAAAGDAGAAPAKRGPGRPRKYADAEAGERQREAAAKFRERTQRSLRDIEGRVDFSQIDWGRRLACKFDVARFDKVYMPSVFYLDWSKDQLRCNQRIQDVFLSGGAFALAMPRAGGKTALCRGGLMWGTAYGHRTFPFLIGSSGPKALQTLDLIKTYWYSSLELRQDFPELAWPIHLLENRQHLAKGQLYRNTPTHIEWGSDSIQYPCLLLTAEDAEPYLRRDEGSLIRLPGRGPDGGDAWIARAAGAMIRTAGIDGSIRGEADVHPILLTQPRPDVVILDDVQKDVDASNPNTVDKLETMVMGAVEGLAGPDKQIAILMPCTVTCEDDLSDRFLSPERHPEYNGERCPLVLAWPDGITNREIGTESAAGKLWNQYADLRRVSYRRHKDGRLATEFYQSNREAMDAGFVVGWESRYDGEIAVSAQQRAMDLRLKDPVTFLAEYQQIGRRPVDAGLVTITADQLAAKQVNYHRGEIGAEHSYLVAFIDVQDEILFWSVLAATQEFGGVFSAYGTWPEVHVRHFLKHQTEQWSLLTRAFFQQYPQQQDKAFKTASGAIRAPLEAKIYHALTLAVEAILGMRFERRGFADKSRVQWVGIDAKWGKAADAIKQFCRETPHREVICYEGHPFNPTNKQLEEYIRTGDYTCWIFEDARHPSARECKWVYRPDKRGMFGMLADVNRLKSFLFNRLASPPGSPGSIGVYQAPVEEHETWARHICDSEYPIDVTARGVKKETWKEKDGRPDNDWLDCAAGCVAMASWAGACLRASEAGPVGDGQGPANPAAMAGLRQPTIGGAATKRFRDAWAAKRGGRRR